MGKYDDLKLKVLEFLRSNSDGKATNEVARHFNLTHSQTVYILSKLALEGKVKRKLKSPRVALWYAVEQ